jgi:hypothetical protein
VLDGVIARTITHLESTTATTVGGTAFTDFGLLQSVNFPLVEIVGQYSFRRCPNLSSVNLPKATVLNMECFSGDTKLAYIDLPMVTAIANGVFASSGLATLIIRTPSVCKLNNISAIRATPIANEEGVIFVPDNLVNDYKSATNWSTYANQIKGLSELEEGTE